MKLPSIDYLFRTAKEAVFRFPITLTSSLIAVIIGIYLTENEEIITNIFPFINLILTFALGIPLFICIELISKKKSNSVSKLILTNAGGIVVLFLLFLTLPSSEITTNASVPYIRYAIYNVALHLLVSFAPFILKKEINGFWQFNKLLFIRLATSVLYSGFLFVGIVLALISLDLLFEVKIHDKLYFDIFIVIAGFFNTWVFVAGIPENLNELEEITTYPIGLKIFTQYVLLPLLVLYLIILYGYGIKIITLWNWPKGIVSYLIICVAILGIFNFLLMYPYGKQDGNRWIKWGSRAYYFILVPLVVMLFMAISIRLNDYGITINRYLIYLLGIWLSLTCLYFIIGKTNIKFIPISLFTLILLMSFGPWSIFNVSENSQVNRLKIILIENQMLLNDKIINEQILQIDSNYTINGDDEFIGQNKKFINDSLKNEIKSILDYLNNYHGFNGIKSWYSQDFDKEIKVQNSKKSRWERINEASVYMRALGLDYTFYNLNLNHLSFSNKNYNTLNFIKGYDYQLVFNSFKYDTQSIKEFEINEDHYQLRINPNKILVIDLLKNQEIIANFDLKVLRDQLIDYHEGNKQNYITQSLLSLSDSSQFINCKIIFENLSFFTENDSLKLHSFNGSLLFRLKD